MSRPSVVLTAKQEVLGPFVVLADCEVFYEGRASSTLRRGHYLLMRKADGSFLVHGASLTVPLNYQPAGSRLFRTPEGYFCQRKNETMQVVVYQVLARMKPAHWDDHRIQLVRTERELRDKLARNLKRYIPGIVRVEKEFPTAYGAADLVAVDRRRVHHVIEVKRARATIHAGIQIRKYLEALAAQGYRVRGYVAAPEITANARTYYRKFGYIYLQVRHAASAKRKAAGRGSDPVGRAC